MAEPPGTEKSLAAKVLTICAVGVLISLGMCGLADQMRGSLGSAGTVFAFAGAVVFVICLLGCAVSLLIIGIAKLTEKF